MGGWEFDKKDKNISIFFVLLIIIEFFVRK